MERVKLQVKAEHFKEADFGSPCNCALSKAAKEQFGVEDVSEGIDVININDIEYSHAEYLVKHFEADYAKADKLGFSNKVIRTITLKR